MALSAGQILSGGNVRDVDDRLVVAVDSSNGGAGSGSAGYPGGAVPVTNSSGNKANASAAATIAAAAGETSYLTGFQITASGATAAGVVTVTVVGVLGGTMSFTFAVPAGVAVGATSLSVSFPDPVPSSAVNTAIVVTLPALGSGNTNATVVAEGFQL